MRGPGSIGAVDVHKTDHTPWDGHMLMERPSVTVLRSTPRKRVAVEIRSWPVA
jgi:hypothetical protein